MDGAGHATRLILMLPPLAFLISFGIVRTYRRLKKKLRFLFLAFYVFILFISFIGYQHYYWIHYLWDSERWWDFGYKESIRAIKEIENNYDKVVISTEGEPPQILFAGWYDYPPDKWQKEFSRGDRITLPGFGEVSYVDKFYFGFPKTDVGISKIAVYMNKPTLYLALAKEVSANLIREPEKTPVGLTLVKAIAYPSGEPAFYLFSGQKK